MKGSDRFTNGQPAFKMSGNKLTYYFKSGGVKAEGPYEDNLMEGEWRFYRENGQLWQIGNFKNGEKDGSWVRYDKSGEIEYNETFRGGKIIKKK